jgi:hypothetical protein
MAIPNIGARRSPASCCCPDGQRRQASSQRNRTLSNIRQRASARPHRLDGACVWNRTSAETAKSWFQEANCRITFPALRRRSKRGMWRQASRPCSAIFCRSIAPHDLPDSGLLLGISKQLWNRAPHWRGYALAKPLSRCGMRSRDIGHGNSNLVGSLTRTGSGQLPPPA